MEERRILEHKPFVNTECFVFDAVIPQNSDICFSIVKNIDLNEPETKVFIWEYITMSLKTIYVPEMEIEGVVCNPNNTYQFIFLSTYQFGIFEYSHSKKKIITKKIIDTNEKEIADITYLKNDSFFSLSNNIQGIVVSYRNNFIEIYDEDLTFKKSFDLRSIYLNNTKNFVIETDHFDEEDDLFKMKLISKKKTLFNFEPKHQTLYLISRGNLLYNFLVNTGFYFILEVNFDNFEINIFSIENFKKDLTYRSSVMISTDGKRIYPIISQDNNGKNNLNRTSFKSTKIKATGNKRALAKSKSKKDFANFSEKSKIENEFHELEKKKISYSCYKVDITNNLLDDSIYILETQNNFFTNPTGVYTKFEFDFLVNSAYGLDIKNIIISDNPRLLITTFFSTNQILFNQQYNLSITEQKNEVDFEADGNFSKGFSDSNDMTQQQFNVNLNFKYLMHADLEYEPVSISINPYGSIFFATFEDSAYIYSILDNGIREVCKISNCCKGSSFSNSGKYFAFSTIEYSKEDYHIVIINSRTLEVEYLITNLSGHATKIIWMDSDRILAALIDEKDVYGWKLNDKRIIARNREKVESNKNKAPGENINPNPNIILRLVECGDKIIDFCYDFAIDFLLILSDEFKVRIFRPSRDDESWDFDLDCKYLSVLLIRKLDIIIFGTSEGSIRICIWPIPNFSKKGQVDHPHYTEKFLHCGKVTQLIVSTDYKFLYSCGSDGSIFVSSLTSFCNDNEVKLNTFMYFNPKNILNKRVYIKYSDFVNLTEPMYKAKMDIIKKRQLDLLGINQEFASELDKINGENSKAIDEKRFIVNNVIERERKKVKNLEDEKELLSKNMKEKREHQIKSFKEEIKYIKKKYKEEKTNLQNKTKNLSNIIKDVKINYNNTCNMVENKKETSSNKLKNMLKNVLKNLNQKLLSMKKIIDSKKLMFDKKLSELEEEKESIIKEEQTNKKRQKEINDKKIMELTTEIDKINKDNINYADRIKEWEKNLRELRENNAELMESFLFNSLKLKQMNKLLLDNENKISDRESIVKDKRLINDRLEKLRFVLEYQIKNLIKERQPIEEQINNFEELHNDFYKRFNLLYAEQLNIEEFITNNLNLIETYKEELSKRKKSLYYLKNVFRALDLEIHFIFRAKIEDKNIILNKLIDIYEKYLKDHVNDEHISSFAMESIKNSQTMEKEIKRQKNKVLKELKNKRSVVRNLHTEKEKLMQKIQWENTQLIEECSSVRLNLEDILKYINDIEKKFIELTNTHVALSKSSVSNNIKNGIKKAKQKIFEADINKGKAAKEAERLSNFFIKFSILDKPKITTLARNSSLDSINTRGDLNTSLLMQLEENKEDLYIQDNQIQRMNQKIKEVIGVNLKINESLNSDKNENENTSNIYNI